MSRVMPWCVIALIPIVISADNLPKSDAKPAGDVQSNVGEESQCAKAVRTLAKLRRPLVVKAIEGVALRDVLKILSETSDVDFVVNLGPFREAGLDRVEEQPIRLPALRRHLTIEETLNLVLPQLNGAFVIRGDYVEITTPKAKLAEFYSNWQFRALFPGGPFESEDSAPGDPNSTTIGLAHVDYTNAPFDKVVRDIAGQAGVNVLIAADEELIKRKVDARWTNVPADLGIRLLADSLQLHVLRFNKMLYICDHGCAHRFEEEYERQLERAQRATPK